MNRFPVELPPDPASPVPCKPLPYGQRGNVPPPPPASVKPLPRLRTVVIGLVLAAALGGVLIPMLWALASGGGDPEGWGQGILQGGLPPTGSDSEGDAVGTETDTSPADTGPETRAESEIPTDPLPADTEESPTDTTEAADTLPAEPETTGPEESVTHPSEEGTDTEPETQPAPETEAPTINEDPAPSVPSGCYPIVTADMSRTDCGAGYVVCDEGTTPAAGSPTGSLWSTDGPPTVLIVNTHPYEGYGDGGAWYDPAKGGLAQTDTPNAAEGTVALGAALARSLRGMGVTVIHLRIAVSAEDSASDIYDRTETVVRSYCRLYPDIGLILDLRRSAELTADGGILRTAGSLNGEPCAQLRISVSGGREPAAAGDDLAAALALRSGLWDISSTVSRPVRVKAGAGIVGDLADVRVLTLEMGSAGNLYAEAESLSAPVAAVLSGMILDSN